MNRIRSIDGFRTIAVLGVLWAHVWMFMGAPSFVLLHVDIAKIISFFGTGVDLFFVISGFCMYLMYVSRSTDLTAFSYFSYLKKRWLRIAPAYYFAVLIYALVACNFSLNFFDSGELIKRWLFIKTFFKGTVYGPHFWSLCTEWHFYIFLPLIVFLISKAGMRWSIVIIVSSCLLYRSIAWRANDDPFNFINYSITNRLIEFVMGIICAWLYMKKIRRWYLSGIIGLLAGVVIAFTGRWLMTDSLVNHTGWIGWGARIINLPLLSLGYALVILNVLNRGSLFKRLLESKLFQRIGKYSYSMYLWHWIFAETISVYLLKAGYFKGFLGVNIIFIITCLIIYPVSYLSYRIFESFYFKNRTKARLSPERVVDPNL